MCEAYWTECRYLLSLTRLPDHRVVQDPKRLYTLYYARLD